MRPPPRQYHGDMSFHVLHRMLAHPPLPVADWNLKLEYHYREADRGTMREVV